MNIHQKWLAPFILILFSSGLYAEGIGGKEGYLKQLSSKQLDSEIHQYLIDKIKIDNPQPYTDKEVHSHPAVWRCTKAVKHKHYGARNHTHKNNCPNRYRGFGRPMPRVAMRRFAPKAAAKPQASSTNVQEQGVDEADFVKTDGRYLFAVSNNDYGRKAGGIRIFDTRSGKKQPRQISAIGFHKSIHIEGMYLMANQLVIIGNSHQKSLRQASRWSGLTHVIQVDIRNKTKPKVLKHIQMEGRSNTTRRIGNQLYLVLAGSNISFPETYRYLETPKKMTKNEYAKVRQELITDIKKWSIKDDLPHYRVLGQSGIKPLMNANNFLLNPGTSFRYSMTTLVSIDLNSSHFRFKTANYFGYSGTVYVSNNAIYVSPHHYGQSLNSLNKSRFPRHLQKTMIHKFAFNRAKGFDYRGTGMVLGNFSWRSNSFQLDEDNKGNLRVVTSNSNSNGKYADPAANSPVVLTALAEHPKNKQLITLSRLPNRQQPKALGKKGEQLYGVRLFNDYAYFVTFKRTDPLYVVDLRNPRSMRVVAALEIPGFSDYLHPISQGLLLGVGKKADDNGRTQGLKISLFDISNPRNPREIDKIHIGESGTHSPANKQHHAFTSLKMHNSPVTRISLPISVVGKDYSNQEQGLHQFEVNSRTKKVAHVGKILPPKRGNQRWYWSNSDRSMIIDNKVYYYQKGNLWAGDWGQQDKARHPVKRVTR